MPVRLLKKAILALYFLARLNQFAIMELMSQCMVLIPLPLVFQPKKIQLQDKIRFELSKPDILPASHPVLDHLASHLKNNPAIKKVEIQAHIDARGSSDFNLKLTQQRAESVRRYLIEKGVAPDRMVAKGYGETRPIHCEPHGCPEKCRRIEIWIIE